MDHHDTCRPTTPVQLPLVQLPLSIPNSNFNTTPIKKPTRVKALSIGMTNETRKQVKSEHLMPRSENTIDLTRAMRTYETQLSSNRSIDNNNSPRSTTKSTTSTTNSSEDPDDTMFDVNRKEEEEDGDSENKDEEKMADFLQAIEVAAFTHMQQWAESADIIKKKIYHKDKLTLMQHRRVTCLCCPNTFSFTYKLNNFLCCCPYFLCCHTVPKPRKSAHPSLFAETKFGGNIDAQYTLICCIMPCCRRCRDQPDGTASDDDFEESDHSDVDDDSDEDNNNNNNNDNDNDNDNEKGNDGNNGQGKNRCCFFCCRKKKRLRPKRKRARPCCSGRASLTLLTAPCIWFNLPLEVVINRGRLLFSMSSQLLAFILEWMFFFSIANTDLQWPSSDNLKLRVRASVFFVAAGCMILPEMVHASYMLFAPGYALRSPSRKCKQFALSMFSFARPAYELA